MTTPLITTGILFIGLPVRGIYKNGKTKDEENGGALVFPGADFFFPRKKSGERR